MTKYRYKRKINWSNITLTALVICLIAITIWGALTVIAGPRITEGYVVDKNVYPPSGRTSQPIFTITVVSRDIMNEWIVSPTYYDSVQIGSYVRK